MVQIEHLFWIRMMMLSTHKSKLQRINEKENKDQEAIESREERRGKFFGVCF